MKTSISIILALSLFISLPSFAQQRVALHSSGVTSIYSTNTPFIDAYTDALAGDTIYLPGGAMAGPTLIDKKLTIIGAGFHPDSTQATFLTKITSEINLGENADGLQFEGVYFESSVSGVTNASINNMEFKRCLFNSSFNIAGNTGDYAENLVLSECVLIGALNLQNTRNCLFSNNIINDQISNTSSNIFSNNIFLREGGSWSSASYRTIYSALNNVFENNIFYNSASYSINGSGNTFKNNLFVAGAPELGTGFIDINNYVGVTQSTLFVNQVGFGWLSTNDNHLQDPVMFVGADATPVGIYGGYFPFKSGAVPQNPHISTKTISNQTDVNGDLNIQLHIEAQNE